MLVEKVHSSLFYFRSDPKLPTMSETNITIPISLMLDYQTMKPNVDALPF